ncbi:rhodanese-like domain-containing protein [Ascidiaceihabitans sp.]|nr:rhodanese-like domain-containing protein [Ascidiaceihabitans sp.]
MRKLVFATLFSLLTSTAFAQETILEAMEDYTGFATYEAGIILPMQVTPDLFHSFFFIDTRTEEEFSQASIDGAINIEWRDVFSRIDEIPKDQKTILFCNTGALSAQSAFGLRVLGYENILILQTGYGGWLNHQAAVSK